MQYVLEGVLLGLGLAILLGPIFIVLVQASIEKGARAGIIAASGIWVSDIIFVVLAIMFVKNISPYVADKGFVFWMGIIGGIILIAVGAITFARKASINFNATDISATGVLGLWTKGFLVNTINPFTFIFWFTTITTFVGERQLNTLETWLWAGSIIVTIIITDSLKVFGAKLIRTSINDEVLSKINKVAGGALIIIGIALMLRSI